MTEHAKTWQDRHAEVAARRAREEALPDEAKRLLESMCWYLISRDRMQDYQKLKAVVVEIWGPK